MGMFDEVRGVELQCPKGHPLDGFQTKDFDCVLGTILFEAGKLVNIDGRTTQCTCGRGVNVPHLVNLYTNCRHEDCKNQDYPSIGTWCEFNLHLDEHGTILEVERVPEISR